jgi:hypothetical protein
MGAKKETDAMVDKGRGVAKNDGDILKAGEVEPLRNFNT